MVVVMVMTMGLRERDGHRTSTNQGGDGKRRRDLFYLHYEHLLLLLFVGSGDEVADSALE
jgi:hypothetical protein